jgi:hypothetical protein
MAAGGDFMTTRSAVKGYLVDLLRGDGEVRPTLAGDRVYRDRFGVLQEEELPAIMVYASEETSEVLDVVSDRRQLKVQIELQAAGDDAGVQLDVMSDQVVRLLQCDEYLGGLVESSRYSRGQLYFDEKRHLNGVCWVIEVDVRWIVSNVPDAGLSNISPFKTAHVDYRFTEGPASPEAVSPITADTIEIPQ